MPRVEITETILDQRGRPVHGAGIYVRDPNGAQVNVYSAETGGVILGQPLSSRGGRIDGWIDSKQQVVLSGTLGAAAFEPQRFLALHPDDIPNALPSKSKVLRKRVMAQQTISVGGGYSSTMRPLVNRINLDFTLDADKYVELAGSFEAWANSPSFSVLTQLHYQGTPLDRVVAGNGVVSTGGGTAARQFTLFGGNQSPVFVTDTSPPAGVQFAAPLGFMLGAGPHSFEYYVSWTTNASPEGYFRNAFLMALIHDIEDV